MKKNVYLAPSIEEEVVLVENGIALSYSDDHGGVNEDGGTDSGIVEGGGWGDFD